MARKVFYSFHYQPDAWRASQVRNAGVVESNQPASDNDWESVKKGGDSAIRAWIDAQLSGRSCTVVLVGADTAGRKWIKYEIEKSWNDGKGVVGIHIHNLLDASQSKASKGGNPFDDFTVGPNKTRMSSIVKCYDPPYITSTDVYGYIKSNLESWIEEAIRIRGNY